MAKLDAIILADVFWVEPENWDAVNIFAFKLVTQWHEEYGLAGRIVHGLRYEGVQVVLARSTLADADDVFSQIQLMECVAVPILNERD